LNNILKTINDFANKQKWDEIVKLVNSLHLKNNTRDLQIYLKRANALRELKQYDQALQAYREITTQYPTNSWAFFFTVELLSLTGEYTEAKKLSKEYFQTFAGDKEVISYFKGRIPCFFMSYEEISVDWFSLISRKNILYTVPKEKPLKIMPPKHNSDYHVYNSFPFNMNIFFSRPKTTIYSYEDVYLSIDYTRDYKIEYYLFDANKQQIKGLSRGSNPFLLTSNHTLDEPVAFIDDWFTTFNVCHFMLDKLTRVEEFRKTDATSYLLLSQNIYTDFFAQLLKLNFVNFTQYNNCSLQKRVTLKLKKFYYSNSSTIMYRHPGHHMHQNSKIMLEKIREQIPFTSKKHKIYIDRSLAKARRALNNDEVKEFLLSKGFEIVQLEKIPVAEQLSLFRNAECVVGTHGAGLTNIAMCEPGTKVIEILPQFYATQAFWKLARALNLDYDTVVATDPEIPNPKSNHFWKKVSNKSGQRDIIVPLDALAEVLS